MLNFIFIFAAAWLGFWGGEARQADIIGIQWTLTRAGAEEVTAALAFIQIDADGKRFSGSTGCNRMSGNAEVKGTKIKFSNVATTKMKCVIEKGDVTETKFLSALKDASTFRLMGNDLHIRDRSGRTTLRFKRLVKLPPVTADEPAVSLEGRKWELEATRSLKPIGKGAFIRFDGEKGSLGGDSGCNVFGGEYSREGNKIEIGDVISTMRACIEDDRMSIERELYDGLRSADRFEIRDDKLLLFKGTELLLTFR
ncbi:MAG TPA: META domain-containing protein [Pyrinomonadaceae bacterium]|nr:META domain-containing protein [Pyrinomonadaceae bacterium]